LILGIGGVGISALLMLKAFGTKKIVAVDKIQSKVDFALTLGVKYALNSSEKNFNIEIKKINQRPQSSIQNKRNSNQQSQSIRA
jgi:Zn-dependent alcohol dehydrogenase